MCKKKGYNFMFLGSFLFYNLLWSMYVCNYEKLGYSVTVINFKAIIVYNFIWKTINYIEQRNLTLNCL